LASLYFKIPNCHSSSLQNTVLEKCYDNQLEKALSKATFTAIKWRDYAKSCSATCEKMTS